MQFEAKGIENLLNMMLEKKTLERHRYEKHLSITLT
jgi:hypothetical protein